MPLLGLRYFTNKCKSLEELEKYVSHYGFRGEAIASIVACSKSVNITSRHLNTGNTYSRTLGKHSSVEVSRTKSRPSVGTTVTIEGFFHNLPVRRKRIIPELELDEIKRGIESLIILHPKVTFSVRNDVTCELILNSQKSQDLISSFKHLHPNLGDDFNLMKISKNQLTIDALIYKTMSENKNLQYIYVNKRPIFSSKIQKLVGSLFKKNKKNDRKNPVAALTKYPVYVINIKCPISKVDVLFNPTKTMVVFENWDIIHRCINKLIDSFFGKDSNMKKKEKFLSEEEFKKDCGVSQIVGAYRRFGYKRKNVDENNEMEKTENDDVIATQIPENVQEKTSRNNKPVLEIENNPKVTSEHQFDYGDSLNISEATSFQGDFRNKKKFKKPLPITVSRAKIAKNQMTKNDDILPEKQDDIKSSISKFTDDQNKGKNLIMDMFLKSTQIYSSDENQDKMGGSQETIYEEESNFQMENNYQTKFKGMSNTMSVSVNVKSTRKIRKRKKQQENPSKYVQTYKVAKTIVSKAVQTSINEKYKKKVRKHRSKGIKFAMNPENYTVVLSEIGKKSHFKFVTKKAQENDVDPNIQFNISQKCHCNCHKGDNKLFDFKEQSISDSLLNENIKLPKIDSHMDQLLKKKKFENLIKYHHPVNQYLGPNRGTFENCNFNVVRKEKTFQNYERSPYFAPKTYLDNNLVCYHQHPHYPIGYFNTVHEPYIPVPYLNLHPVELNRNFRTRNTAEHDQPPFNNVFQNNPILMENKKHFYKEEVSKINDPNDWTVGTFGQFKPVHLSTQKDKKNNDWRNSSFKQFEPFHLNKEKEWTINSFGQFQPSLFSTQKNEKTDMLFTPSPVEHCNPPIETSINLLNDSQENHQEVIEILDSNSEDIEKGPEEIKDGTVSKLNDHSKLISLSKQRTQEILDKELEGEKSLLAKEFLNWDSQFTQDFGNDWLKKFNKCGNCYYMNKKTGFTTFQTPELGKKQQFKFGKRFDFLPKGMSPILTETKQVDKSLSQNGKDKLLEYIMETYKNELLYIKWQHYLSDVDPETFFKNIYKEKLKMFEGCIPDISTSKKKNNINNVISFNKELFENIEVIGQLDKKFIVVLDKKSNLLVLFDQHAVHERIRLEELLKKYDGAKSECDEKLVFFVPQNDLSLLQNHESYLDYLGISMEIFGNGVNISAVPLCLFSKFKDNNFSDTLNKMMQLLIKEIIEHLKSTRGVHLKSLPKLLQNVVNLEACRGAIKFGDSLSKERCRKLLVQLSSCDLPFQCAHGRPTIAPLIVLELNEKIGHSKPNFLKLK
ncbi:unnamed protein product [Phaedon cochleariae]|uniref:WW domain-containing protein n=1 Tax=Phaedon cochleariae TaxID=80249 RepID=A0A9P0DCU4_PHACE|nr:unnamed protein product [Phaedon cochleariae]